MLTLSYYQSRPFVVTFFMELSNRELIFRGSEDPLKFENSVIEALSEEIKMFLVVDQSAIPIRNVNNRLVRPVILSVQNNPITFGSCDVRLKVGETN